MDERDEEALAERVAQSEKQIAEIKQMLTDPELAPGVLAIAVSLDKYRPAGYKRPARFLADTGKAILRQQAQSGE